MQTESDFIQILEAPILSGLTFRNFRGESDYPLMLSLYNAAQKADYSEGHQTLEDMMNNYAHLTNCDPYRDVLIAEVNGEPACYSRVTWWIEESTRNYIYLSFGCMAPEWRGKGIGQAMLHYNQRRLLQIASEHPRESRKMLEAFAMNSDEGGLAMLLNDGYQVIRRFYSMVRPDLENIPDLPLPEGLEVRPVKAEHIRQIWDASQEAFRDHWGYAEPEEKDYQNWVNSSEFQPDLWQVAWDGDEVAGMILNYINHAENQEYNRLRGYTEGICVRRSWRRHGLARALLARSLKMHRDLGMTEAGLGVDTESLSGANILYESMGFRPVTIQSRLRKPLILDGEK